MTRLRPIRRLLQIAVAQTSDVKYAVLFIIIHSIIVHNIHYVKDILISIYSQTLIKMFLEGVSIVVQQK